MNAIQCKWDYRTPSLLSSRQASRPVFLMLRFIIKRLLITIPTILVVITITWGLVRLAPGNFYTGEKKLPSGN